MWHVAALQLKAGLTPMTNLGQVCLFSNLITVLHLFNDVDFGIGVVGASLFFTGFKVLIYWWMIKISKGVGI